jgi:hypothetical protein
MSIPWGEIISFTVIQITGYPYFDYFFTLLLVFGLMSWFIGLFFNLITRS